MGQIWSRDEGDMTSRNPGRIKGSQIRFGFLPEIGLQSQFGFEFFLAPKSKLEQASKSSSNWRSNTKPYWARNASWRHLEDKAKLDFASLVLNGLGVQIRIVF